MRRRETMTTAYLISRTGEALEKQMEAATWKRNSAIQGCWNRGTGVDNQNVESYDMKVQRIADQIAMNEWVSTEWFDSRLAEWEGDWNVG